MAIKAFSQRFNQELLLLSFPEDINDKVRAVAKVLNVSGHKARSMMMENLVPSRNEIERIAEILDVCPRWLAGETDRKRNYKPSIVEENN